MYRRWLIGAHCCSGERSSCPPCGGRFCSGLVRDCRRRVVRHVIFPWYLKYEDEDEDEDEVVPDLRV